MHTRCRAPEPSAGQRFDKMPRFAQSCTTSSTRYFVICPRRTPLREWPIRNIRVPRASNAAAGAFAAVATHNAAPATLAASFAILVVAMPTAASKAWRQH